MKTLNQKGFSPLEVLLVIIMVIGIGGAGWYVKSQDKSKPNNSNDQSEVSSKPENKLPNTDEDTDKWMLFTAKALTYSLRLPDGGKFVHQTDNDFLYAAESTDFEYNAGTPAVIKETTGGRDGGLTFSVSFYDLDTAGEFGFDKYTKIGEFSTNDGVKGTKYYYVEPEGEGIGPTPGTKQYYYYFVKDNKAIYASYSQPIGAPDQLDLAEQTIKTLKFL